MSLGLLAFMVSGPFLWPFHGEPLPGFWSEWWAGAFGLSAVTTGLIATRGRAVMLPLVLLVPAVMLLNLLLQFGLGRLAFPQIGLIYAAYLLWAGMLVILGRHLADTVGFGRVADVLAGAIALAALIGAGIALVQWSGLPVGGGWIFPKLGSSVYANLGQANHHAHYSWLGIVSVFYLRGRGCLPRSALWLLVLPIAFGSVLSGSRSMFIYPLVLVAAVAWARHRDPHSPAAKLMTEALIMLPVLVGLNFLGVWASPRITEFWAWLGITASTGGAAMPGTRLFAEVSGPSIRLAIMSTAWIAFAEHPWLGQGVGNYIWASFVAASSQSGGEPLMVAEHAHNLVFHLLAELGAPATLAVILLLFLWIKQFFRQQWTLAHVWCAAVLGMGAVHSLLEYPLWYSYFLGPTALLLGAGDSRPSLALPARRAMIYVVLLCLSGIAILSILRKDYTIMEMTSYAPLAAHADREQAWRISMDRLLKLHRESLLSPWALLAFSTMADPSRDQAQHRATLCERSIRFSPARWLVLRCGMQMAIAGRDQEARQLTRAALRAYPLQRTETENELARAALEYPEIRPLRALGPGD